MTGRWRNIFSLHIIKTVFSHVLYHDIERNPNFALTSDSCYWKIAKLIYSFEPWNVPVWRRGWLSLPSLPSPKARTRESRYSGRRPVNHEVICWSIELEAGTNVDILQKLIEKNLWIHVFNAIKLENWNTLNSTSKKQEQMKLLIIFNVLQSLGNERK